MSIFTAAHRRSLERISGNYFHLTSEESDFTLSDVFSLGLLLSEETSKTNRNEKEIAYYKSAYTSVCGAMKISNPEIFLIRLVNVENNAPWDDFSDFNGVWYPKWFTNQLWLRKNLFTFTNEEEQKIRPDFWGVSCADAAVKTQLTAVKDSFQQIRVGVLAMVFKVDSALAALLGWSQFQQNIPWKDLKEKYSFPRLGLT